jgi:hypothetical protein
VGVQKVFFGGFCRQNRKSYQQSSFSPKIQTWHGGEATKK